MPATSHRDLAGHMKRFSVSKLLQRPRGSKDAVAPAIAPPRRDSEEDQDSHSSPQPQVAPPPTGNLQISQTQPLPPRAETAVASSAAATGPLPSASQQRPQKSPATPTGGDGGGATAAALSTENLESTALVKAQSSIADGPHGIPPDLAQVRLAAGCWASRQGHGANRQQRIVTMCIPTSVKLERIMTMQYSMKACVDTMASRNCRLWVTCAVQQFRLYMAGAHRIHAAQSGRRLYDAMIRC